MSISLRLSILLSSHVSLYFTSQHFSPKLSRMPSSALEPGKHSRSHNIQRVLFHVPMTCRISSFIGKTSQIGPVPAPLRGLDDVPTRSTPHHLHRNLLLVIGLPRRSALVDPLAGLKVVICDLRIELRILTVRTELPPPSITTNATPSLSHHRSAEVRVLLAQPNLMPSW